MQDRKIELLEIQIQQMMKDTRSWAEEQVRMQKENAALHRTITNMAATGSNTKQHQAKEKWMSTIEDERESKLTYDMLSVPA